MLGPTKLAPWLLGLVEGEKRFYRCSVLQNENASQVLGLAKEVSRVLSPRGPKMKGFA